MLASAPNGLGGMVGAGGLEPPHGGSKGRCLTSLATPQDRPLVATRHPAWRHPNGGRSDYPAFGGSATRAQTGGAKAARASARAASRGVREDPEDRGPAAREADRSRPLRPQPLAQRGDRRAQALGRRREVVREVEAQLGVERRRRRTGPGGRRRPRTRRRSRGERRGSRARTRAAGNPRAARSARRSRRRARGAGPGSRARRRPGAGRGGRAPAPRARPGSAPRARAARRRHRSSRRPGRPPPESDFVRRMRTARASPAAARNSAAARTARLVASEGTPAAAPASASVDRRPGRIRDLELDLVGQVEGHEDALELVIAVRAAPEDAQAQIDLGRREHVNARGRRAGFRLHDAARALTCDTST